MKSNATLDASHEIECGQCGGKSFQVETHARLGGNASIFCQRCRRLIWSKSATTIAVARLFTEIQKEPRQ